MNTADIRNTDRDQRFFWAIAIPITASIVGVAVLFAYQGDKLYNALFKASHRWGEDSSTNFIAPSLIDVNQLQNDPQPFHAESWSLRKRSWFGSKRSNADSVLLT